MEEVNLYLLQQTVLHLSGQYTDPVGFSYKASEVLDALQIDLCSNLYNTGGRYSDIAKLSSVVSYDDLTVTFQASKGGNQFTVSRSLLSANFITRMISGVELYPTCRYRSFIIWLSRALHPFTYIHADKNISSHLFRYAFIKSRADEGYSDSQISAMIGEADNKNTAGYREGLLYRY